VIASWAVADATFNAPISKLQHSRSTTMSKKSKSEKNSKSEKKAKQVSAPGGRKMRPRVASAHGGYGWSRDLPDARDVMYAAPLLAMAKGLPSKVDLRPKCPPVYNQGQLGCCTGNGIAAAIEFDQMKLGKKNFEPSRLFIYYNERVMENTVASDAGAQIRDGIKSVATVGAPPESVWPYDIKKFADQPPPLAYTDAKLDLVASYAKVAQVLQQMQGCLASGYPFVIGFTVYESFESAAVAKSGIAPMPAPGEQVVGGHCVVAVGYDDKTRTFILRNSWGTGWGIKGYFTLPYEYLCDAHLASDFWTIRSVTE
jgi:C1A family cysteine protease